MGESGPRRATGTRDYSRSTYFSLTFLSTRRHEASYAPNRPAPLSNDPLSNKAVRRPKWSRVAWTETMQAGLLNPKVTEHKACLLFHGYSENERTQLDDRAESKMPLLGRETVEHALMRTSSSVSPLVASASTSSAVEEQLVKCGAYQALLVGTHPEEADASDMIRRNASWLKLHTPWPAEQTVVLVVQGCVFVWDTTNTPKMRQTTVLNEPGLIPKIISPNRRSKPKGRSIRVSVKADLGGHIANHGSRPTILQGVLSTGQVFESNTQCYMIRRKLLQAHLDADLPCWILTWRWNLASRLWSSILATSVTGSLNIVRRPSSSRLRNFSLRRGHLPNIHGWSRIAVMKRCDVLYADCMMAFCRSKQISLRESRRFLVAATRARTTAKTCLQPEKYALVRDYSGRELRCSMAQTSSAKPWTAWPPSTLYGIPR